MAIITITISDDSHEPGRANVHMHGHEAMAEQDERQTPAQVLASHLHEHICKLERGIRAEVARQRKAH